eukprot:5786341-Pyramimonas_sp.AAC.1
MRKYIHETGFQGQLPGRLYPLAYAISLTPRRVSPCYAAELTRWPSAKPLPPCLRCRSGTF